jgi:hypothetical protein
MEKQNLFVVLLFALIGLVDEPCYSSCYSFYFILIHCTWRFWVMSTELDNCPMHSYTNTRPLRFSILKWKKPEMLHILWPLRFNCFLLLAWSLASFLHMHTWIFVLSQLNYFNPGIARLRQYSTYTIITFIRILSWLFTALSRRRRSIAI